MGTKCLGMCVTKLLIIHFIHNRTHTYISICHKTRVQMFYFLNIRLKQSVACIFMTQRLIASSILHSAFWNLFYHRNIPLIALETQMRQVRREKNCDYIEIDSI